jgi:hypothetical protein
MKKVTEGAFPKLQFLGQPRKCENFLKGEGRKCEEWRVESDRLDKFFIFW